MPDYSMFCVHYPENSGHYRYQDESDYPDVAGGALTSAGLCGAFFNEQGFSPGIQSHRY